MVWEPLYCSEYHQNSMVEGAMFFCVQSFQLHAAIGTQKDVPQTYVLVTQINLRMHHVFL
jgi:hypothetical protein